MFYEYQTEIIGLGAIVAVVLLYIILKSKQNKHQQLPLQQIEDSVEIGETEVVVDEYDIAEDESAHKTIEEIDVIEGEEEGSFSPLEETHEITQQQYEPQTTPAIIKKAVPPHGKITKENFKEFAGVRILVAEDNLINQKVISGLLADSGIELVIADDGQIALDILQEDDNFLLILMDAHMPRVDGFEATKQIRKNPKYDHILIVALSGDTAADDIKKMREAGMSEHLEKPLRINDLYDILYAYADNFTALANSKASATNSAFQTQELNGVKGLEICGGDETFYHEILDEFVTNYTDSAERLSDMLYSDKLQEADKLLLDIIGVASNIGAEPLQEIAQHLKISLQDTQEKSYFTLLEQYKSHLYSLVKDIQRYHA